MLAATFPPGFYSAFAVLVLVTHALFLVWVIFGALLTGSNTILRWLHIASLVWGILIEVLDWPCPLTFVENMFEEKAGVEPYQGGFLLHYLDKLVYPNISVTTLTISGIVICTLNVAVYARRFWINRDRTEDNHK